MMSYLTLTIDLGGETGQLGITNSSFNSYMLKMLESNSTNICMYLEESSKMPTYKRAVN